MARTVLPSWAVRVLMRRYIVSGMSSVVLMALIISYLIRHINMDLLIYAYPLERAQDFLPSLPRRFLLIDGKRFEHLEFSRHPLLPFAVYNFPTAALVWANTTDTPSRSQFVQHLAHSCDRQTNRFGHFGQGHSWIIFQHKQ